MMNSTVNHSQLTFFGCQENFFSDSQLLYSRTAATHYRPIYVTNVGCNLRPSVAVSTVRDAGVETLPLAYSFIASDVKEDPSVHTVRR
jgi:hypothetical protein